MEILEKILAPIIEKRLKAERKKLVRENYEKGWKDHERFVAQTEGRAKCECKCEQSQQD